jgi:hypothetical protein
MAKHLNLGRLDILGIGGIYRSVFLVIVLFLGF